MVTTSGFFYRPLQTANIVFSTLVRYNKRDRLSGGGCFGNRINIYHSISIFLSCITGKPASIFINNTRVSGCSPESARLTTYLTIRETFIIFPTSDKTRFRRARSECGTCRLSLNMILQCLCFTLSGTIIIHIRFSSPSLTNSCCRSATSSHIREITLRKAATITIIGRQHRFTGRFINHPGIGSRVNRVALRGRSAVEPVHGITGDSVGPRGTIAFAGAFRRDIDDRTADRQVGIFQRTYIRFATVITAGIIRQVEIFRFRTRHIIGAIRGDRRGVDARVVIQRNERYLTAVQRSVALYRVTDIARRVDENRIGGGITVCTREVALVIFLRRHR